MKTSSIKPWRFLPWFLIAPLGLYAQATSEGSDDEQVIELSPFEVTGDDDIGYQATSTLAGTRLRTDLRDIGSSISIVNEEFLNDTASTNLEDVLVFTPNTEVGGLGGNFTGSQGFGNPIPELQRDNQRGGVTRVRGLSAADLTRDYYLTDTPFDTYNTDRIDVQRGANSALFGLGSPGGIVNASTIRADFLGNRGRIRFETDQYGTARTSLRYNLQANDMFAVRVAGLNEEKRFEQKQAFTTDNRIFAAATVRLPYNLTIRGSAEYSERSGSRPDFIPPNDAITPWINLGKPTVSTPAYGGALFRGNGDFFPGRNNNQVMTLLLPGTSSGYSNWYQDPSNPEPTWGGPAFVRRNEGLPNPWGPITGSPGEWMMLMPFTETEIIRRTGGFRSDGSRVADGTSGFYSLSNVSYQITDRSIFDYRENLFSGGTSQNSSEFELYHAAIEGNYFDNRLGFEIGYFEQRMDTRGNNSLQGNMQRSIYIDPNAYLIGTTNNAGDGPLIPNPNYGRPVMGGLSGGNDLTFDRDSFRMQAYYEMRFDDFMDEDSWITTLLGKLTVTGLMEESTAYEKEAYSRDNIDIQAIARAIGGGDTTAFVWPAQRTGQQWALPVGNDRDFLSINSLADLAGADIRGVPHGKANNRPEVFSTFNAWSIADGRFVEFGAPTYTLQDGENFPAAFFAGKSLTEVESQVAVGQWDLWDNTVVLTGTWRNDVQRSDSVGAPTMPGRVQVENIFDPNYVAGPNDLTEDADEDTTSWSVMVHTPRFLEEKLPFTLSVYASEADNFQPSGGRVNVYNEQIAPVTGATEEMGFIIGALDGKLSARFNFYETGVLNNSFDVGGISPYAGILTNLVTQLANPDNIAQGFTVQDSQAVLAPQGTQDVSGFVPDWNNLTATTNRNSGDNGTQDFTAEGMEIEIAYNPTPKWTLLLTAAQQETVTSNTYPTLGRLVNEFVIPQWINTSFAQNFFINSDSTETLAQQAQRVIVDPYNRGRLQDGNPSKEQAEWRWAFNTSYSLGEFDDGFLKFFGDITVGGGLRWEDRVGIGFNTTTNSLGDVVEDVNQPYWSDTSLYVDVFARMRWKLQDQRSFTFQLNIKDLTNNDDLKAFRATPDGRELYRFTEGRLFAASATLEF